MQKTLLILGAGPDQTLGIIKAKKMGYRVVVTDGDKTAQGLLLADDYEIASVYDIKRTVNAAVNLNKKFSINGVMTLGIDTPIVVAKVAEKFNLPGPSLKTAILASNKLEMKKQLKKYQIPIPWFSEIKSLSQLKRIINQKDFPLVIKPVDSRAARGVLRLTNNIDPENAYYESLSYSPSKEILVEEYLKGPQISTESIIWDNFSTTPGFSDRNYEYLKKFSPYMIENGGTLPSTLTSNEQIAIKRTVETAARSLGINRWTAKGDMVLTKSGPKVIEIAARISGGFFATVQIPHNTGVDIVKAAILMALGERPNLEELKIKFQRPVAQRYFFLKAGKIRKITGIKTLNKTSWVKHFSIWVKILDVLSEVKHMGKRCGMVIVTGKSREEVTSRAKKAIGMVHFQIEKNESI